MLASTMVDKMVDGFVTPEGNDPDATKAQEPETMQHSSRWVLKIHQTARTQEQPKPEYEAEGYTSPK